MRMNYRKIVGLPTVLIYVIIMNQTTLFAASTNAPAAQSSPAVIHVTDLFRPHNDPDDHWDLACEYALAQQGAIHLKGIVIDSPPEERKAWNPDVMAVAQLNRITGLSVSVAVGSSIQLESINVKQVDTYLDDIQGVNFILDTLRTSKQPVIIHVIGSCRDIAIAGKLNPDLFAQKCAGIYLNAGTGSPDQSEASKLEYNVKLSIPSYKSIFDIPCPLYWMPCFEEIKALDQLVVREFGTHYKFRQNEILPFLTKKMRNYFVYMFGRYTGHNWLRYLNGENEMEKLAQFGEHKRHMWCTAGFLHAAGYTVDSVGHIDSLDKSGIDSVFTFEPIRVTCDENGVTEWRMESDAKDRFIFHVLDTKNYQQAMTKAMKTLLMEIP